MDNRWLLANHIEDLRGANGSVDLELGQRRLKRWKESPALKHENLFEEFLRSIAFSEPEFLHMLATKPEISGAEPAWLKDVLAALRAPLLKEDPILLKALEQGDATAPFLKWIWPLVAFHADKLRSRINDDNVVRILLEPLIPHLRRMLHRTMILEVNIARLEDRLEGETPRERFQSFLRTLDQPETREALLLEYPSLARRYRDTLHDWVEASVEFVERFRADSALLKQEFGAAGPFVSIQGNMGDAHRSGRSVIVLQFADGTKVVYKPRSLALDAEFQNLVTWIGESGLKPSLKTYKIADRGAYGWTEFVPFKSCETPEQIEKFYLRQGAWLALLYVLGGTDLHLENVIASGEYPMNIDLETLFHPHLTMKLPTNADEAAVEKMEDSVMAIGLLPSPVHLDGGKVLDKSGLGASANQTLNFEVDGMTDIDTDEIRIIKVPGKIGEIQSSPRLNGQAVSPHLYRSSVKRGFEDTYRFLQATRPEVLERLERFRGLPTRIVLRASALYGSLLAEALHPKLYRNSLERVLLFSQLWAHSALQPAYKRVIQSEVKQLLRGDIPYFVSRTDSCDLIDSDGENFDQFLARTGFDVARGRIERLGDEDLHTQLWFIDTSYASVAKVPRGGMRWGDHLETIEVTTPMGAALAAGRQLANVAIEHDQGIEKSASWLSLRFKLEADEAGHYNLGVVEDDLYSGLSGIVFFLAYLGEISGEKQYRQLAERGLSMLEMRLATGLSHISIGTFTGLGGFIYLYAHLASLWSRSDLLARAEELIPAIEALISQDTRFDLIAGVAGVIPALLALKTSRALGVAELCGEHLLQASVIEGETLRLTKLPMLRGLSHGYSSLALAMSELARVTGAHGAKGTGEAGENKWLDAAVGYTNYERGLLAGGHWTDIDERKEQATWCHGAPGIALGRLAMARAHGREDFYEDASAALDATLSAPSLQNQILCHGSLGNLETLLSANLGGDRLADKFAGKFSEQIRVKTAAVLEDVRKLGWVSPLPPNVIEAGLMKGLAGIGLGFLRLAAPDKVPNVLRLEPPSSFCHIGISI